MSYMGSSGRGKKTCWGVGNAEEVYLVLERDARNPTLWIELFSPDGQVHATGKINPDQAGEIADELRSWAGGIARGSYE